MNCGDKENNCIRHDIKKMSDEAILNDYKKNFKEIIEDELNGFRDASLTLDDCIKNSFNYKDLGNLIWKKHNHQYRVPKDVVNKVIKILLQDRAKMQNESDFTGLHNIIAGLISGIKYIGELTVYDIALRIGARLEKYPKEVYLHRGSLEGAVVLLGKNAVKDRIVEKSVFPDVFRDLESYEIEHILCIYRNNFIPFASRPELNRTYFLTRIFRQPETDTELEDKERHKNAVYEKGKVTSAFLEPVFNDFSGKIFYENAEDIKFITDETNESLCSSVYNDNFNDGNFVKVVKKDGRQILIPAEEDEAALFNKKRHNTITETLIEFEGNPDREIFARGEIKGAYSYHVNVGHGNTSFLIVCFRDKNNAKPVVVCIDCKRKRAGRDAINFNACVSYIKNKFSINKFELDIFLLTHPHIDHFSGIVYLLNKRYITNNTEIWLNTHYGYPSSFYNAVLEPLSLKCPRLKFVNPVSLNSFSGMNIWYPEKIIKHNGNESSNTQIEQNPNNASVVTQFLFTIGMKKADILFTGDIEMQGWDKVHCLPFLGKTKNYCISHHGSRNGYQRNFCHNGRTITKITDCRNSIKNAILMGKDGAHKGIYYKPLLDDFGTRVKKTEEAKFLEIDLLSGCCYKH
jgi:hypothetical protein